jgi:hypothetical protein
MFGPSRNKYFMREHLLMRECRHPNIVLFLGLAHEPVQGGRTFVSPAVASSRHLRRSKKVDIYNKFSSLDLRLNRSAPNTSPLEASARSSKRTTDRFPGG